jgi:hypothetical protein
MRKIFNKFKNIHFLWMVGIICFLTFYVPVKCFTDYTNYIPEWSLPIFIAGTMVPLWFNNIMWRSSGMNSSHYMMFHDLHFDNKKWKKQTANVWLVITKYTKWLFRRKMFILLTLINITALVYGFYAEYDEEFILPFTPFYFINSYWWISLIAEFVKFKGDVEEGLVRYGKAKRDGPKTHFMEEWFDEERRVMEFERNKRNKK